MGEGLKTKLGELVEEYNRNVEKLTALQEETQKLGQAQLKLLGKIELLQEQLAEETSKVEEISPVSVDDS